MRPTWIVVVAMLGCRSDTKPRESKAAAAVGSDAAPVSPEIESEVAKLAASEQATARMAKGTIAIKRAWRSKTGPKVVFVDVDFGSLPVDTDDLELVDADRNGVSAIGDARRLDSEGNLVAMGGVHGHDNHFLLEFSTGVATKRVSLRYWGETLTAAPIEIAASGPEFSEPKREVVRHFAKGDRHVLVFEDHNLESPPSPIMDHITFDGGECEMAAILRVSASLAVVEPAAEAFPPHALYAADYRCAKPPTHYTVAREVAIPAAETWAVPAATVAALDGRGPQLAIVELAASLPSLAMRRDGAMIAIAAPKQDIQLVDAAGARIGTIPPPAGELSRLGFTPDGTRLWGVEERGEVIVWDVEKRARVASRLLAPTPSLYMKPALSSDGKWLVVDTTNPDATVAGSGQVTVLAMPDLGVQATVKIVDGDKGSIVDLQLSPDGKRVVVCATTRDESLVRVLGLPRGEQQVAIRSTTSRAKTCALAPDGRVVVGTEAGEIETYNHAGKKVSTVTTGAGVTTIAIRPDGTVLTGGVDGRVVDWATGSGRVLFKHRFPVGDIVIAGDQVASTAPYDAAVVARGKVVARFVGSPDGVWGIAAVPGVVAVGEIAVARRSSRVRIWRAASK